MPPEAIIIVVLLGGIAALENATVQFLLSEPIILCAAAGAMMGDFEAGLMMGVLWQLIWLNEMQIGAAKIPDAVSGSLVSAMLYLSLLPHYPDKSNTLFLLTFLCGLAAAYLGVSFVVDKRKLLSRYNEYVDDFIEGVRPRVIETIFVLSILEQFFFGALFAGLLFFLLYFPLTYILERIPFYWETLFHSVKFIVFGIGAGVIFRMFINRKTVWSAVIGILLGYVFIRLI
ncbi:PTS sugar transporter subunit IIC [bacterium]|nr:PTS sugar transporter subunit IIC [bacterium]